MSGALLKNRQKIVAMGKKSGEAQQLSCEERSDEA